MVVGCEWAVCENETSLVSSFSEYSNLNIYAERKQPFLFGFVLIHVLCSKMT